MHCQECEKKPATLHFTKIVNGEKTEFHLCDSCAREKGEFIPGTANGFSIHNLISGLLDFDPKNSTPLGSVSKAVHCEECGMSYAQFSKLGRFGCDSCYDYFAERLDPLLRRIHGNTSHVGKVPKRSAGHIQIQRDIDFLKKDLIAAIQQEEFEKAAMIRDEIRELEKQRQIELME
jgi:protein arginine kinase activator